MFPPEPLVLAACATPPIEASKAAPSTTDRTRRSMTSPPAWHLRSSNGPNRLVLTSSRCRHDTPYGVYEREGEEIAEPSRLRRPCRRGGLTPGADQSVPLTGIEPEPEWSPAKRKPFSCASALAR